jgi:site-specific recombinase XerD
MTPNHALVAPHLQAFFSDYLCQQKRVSPQTVASYRDTFRLFLTCVKKRTGIEPSTLRMTDVDAPTVGCFLESLEQQRGNTIRSRNLRLSAIRTFFRFVALRDPTSVGITTRVLAIPAKREDKKIVGYLTREEMDALLAAPDRSRWVGRRDYALLLTMYNSGARVSEIVALERAHVTFGASILLHLHGKGRKDRTVPLWPHTGRVLRAWFQEVEQQGTSTAFPTARGTPLSRDSVEYLVHRAVQGALARCPSLRTKRISPHVLRHTTAMNLLQAGVDIAVIALWLGHESIETTHVYLEADLATKERALSKLTPVEGHITRFKADDPLLAFLASL